MSSNSLRITEVVETLTRCQAELLALDISLKSANDRRELAKSTYQTRRDFLQKLQTKLAQQKLLAITLRDDQSDPVLRHASSDEVRLIDACLSAELAVHQSVYQVLGRVFRWLDQTVRQRSWLVLSMLRLAKLKKLIAQCDQEIARSEGMKRVYDLKMPKDSARSETDSASSSTSLYLELDTLTNRVDRLTMSVQREESLLQQMRTWLDTQQRALPQPTAIPSLSTTMLSLAKAKKDPEHPYAAVQTRLQLAKDFVEKSFHS